MSKKMALIGWRGMVGSVLIQRMLDENDFDGLDTTFFSTSQAGEPGPSLGGPAKPLQNAFDIDALAAHDVIVTCQGGDYTKEVHPQLRAAGWDGYWIDAASALRMEPDSVIVLDPVNRAVIDRALERGIKNFIGGNCTVSLMLLAVHGLIERGWVEWISSMTYQSASGAGAAQMKELVVQMNQIGGVAGAQAADARSPVLAVEKSVTELLRSADLTTDQFGAPLAASLIPWIDRAMENGQTREEWKGQAETNKILETETPIPVDGQCVRVGAMRCHSQGLTIKLTHDVPLAEIESVVRESNEWVRWVANTKEDTLRELTPAAVTGKLDIAIGRVRKLAMGPDYLTAFTVGDQLLWGAAEPVRRMLNIVLGRI
jgi:aspartate-semialdehyde dehydrogenase